MVWQSNSLIFMFDGKRVNSVDTPASLDIEDEDEIDVMRRQLGGSC